LRKQIRRVREPEEQQAETCRYWQSLPVGAQFSAAWDLSEAAYAFAAAFKGKPESAIVRIKKQDDRIK
jgi:hypothetical protein